MSKKFRDILSKSKYKEGSKKYKEDIKNGVEQSIEFIHNELHQIFNTPSSEPQTLLYACRMLKDGVQLGNPSFVTKVQIPGKGILYELQRIISQFKNQKMQDYGKTLFGDQPSEDEKTVGKSIVYLSIECVQVWAIWFHWDERTKNITNYQKVFQQLKSIGIQFPVQGQMTYFKEEEKLKFQGAITQGGKLPPPSKPTPQNQAQDEEELQIKLEDFENLKTEVRKNLDDKIETKLVKIEQFFKDFFQIFQSNQPPQDPELKNLFIIDLQACEKVLNLIKQIKNKKISVNSFLQQLAPHLEPCEGDIFGLQADEALELENEQLKQQLGEYEEQIQRLKDQIKLHEKNNGNQETLKKQAELETKNLESEIQILKRKNQQLEDTNESLKQQQSNSQNQVQQLDNEKVDDLERQLEKSKKEIKDLNRQIQVLQDNEQQGEESELKLQKEINQLKNDLRRQKDKYQEDVQNINNQDDELNNAKRQILSLEQNISTKELEFRKQQQQLKDLQEQIDEYDEYKAKYEQDMEQIKKQHKQSLDQEINKNKESLEKANMEYVDTYIKLDNQIQQNQEKEQQISNLQSQIQILKLQQNENNDKDDKLQQTEKIYQDQQKQQQQKIQEQQQEISNLDQNILELKKEKEDMKRENNDLKQNVRELNNDYMKEQGELRKAEQRIRQLENNNNTTNGKQNDNIVYQEDEEVVFSAQQSQHNQQRALKSKNPNSSHNQNSNNSHNNIHQQEQVDKPNYENNNILHQKILEMEQKQQKIEQELEFTKKLNQAQLQMQQSALQIQPNQNQSLAQTQVSFPSTSTYFRPGYHQQQLQQNNTRSAYFSPQSLQPRPASQGKIMAQQPIKLSQYFGGASTPQQNFGTQSQYNNSSGFYKTAGNKILKQQKVKVQFDSDKFNFRGFKDTNQIIRFQKSCFKHKYPIYTRENELVVGIMAQQTPNNSNMSGNKSAISSNISDQITYQIYFTNKSSTDIYNLSFLMDEINIPRNSLTTERIGQGKQKKIDIHFQFKGDQKIIWASLQYNIGNNISRERVPLPNTIFRFLELQEIEPLKFQDKWESCIENQQQTDALELETKVIENINQFSSKLSLYNLNQQQFAQTYSGNSFNLNSRLLQSYGGLYYLRTTNTKILLKVEGKENIVTFYASHINTTENESLYHSFVVENFLQTMIMIFTKMTRF